MCRNDWYRSKSSIAAHIFMGRNTAGEWNYLAKEMVTGFSAIKNMPILCSWKPEARSCKLDTRCKLDRSLSKWNLINGSFY